MEGKLEIDAPFPKQELTYTERFLLRKLDRFGWLFGKKVEKTKNETYIMLILRMVYDLITELEIMNCENIGCEDGYLECDYCNGTSLDMNDEKCQECEDGLIECECNPNNKITRV